MADYHVNCGLAGIYAGTLNKTNTEWVKKSDVTKEAISAVAQYLLEHKIAMTFDYHGKHYKFSVKEVDDDQRKS